MKKTIKKLRPFPLSIVTVCISNICMFCAIQISVLQNGHNANRKLPKYKKKKKT